ncbi:MAG TPA: glycosidase [Clostridiales bacterium]|nr:glycosidase [Clostridiales bacterium]
MAVMINIERLGVVLESNDELEAKFNAGMVLDNGKVHMLYRKGFLGKRLSDSIIRYSLNQIHYALLDYDGLLIREDSEVPVIAPGDDSDRAGCEDPRIVKFEGRFYIFYTAYDGVTPRVAVAVTDDFESYTKLGVIPTLVGDKDAFIFPERINNKIAYIHRIEPDIQIDYFDSIEDLFDKDYWQNYEPHEKILLKGIHKWENIKIGGGVPPIRTDEGWLFIYHGVSDDRTPFCYRVGAALLDLENPSIVLSRLSKPLLEPTEGYERYGDVNEVVFPQGAYMKSNWLYISYGAADKRVALARIDFNDLMNALKLKKVEVLKK